MITLDKRLKMVYNLIEKCNVFADIGSDHGYLPLKLLLDKKIKRVVVSDLNEGPLTNAIENFMKYDLMDSAEFILNDGLKGIEKTNAFAICGMGGELICKILSERKEIARSAKFFVLQPMNNVELVRRFLHDNDYTIVKEDIVKDKNLYYIAFRVICEKDYTIYDEIFYELGYNLYIEKNILFLEYVDYKIGKYKKIVSMCEHKETQNAKRNKEKYILKIKKLEGVKKRYENL